MHNENQDHNDYADDTRSEHPVRQRLRDTPERFGDFAEDDGQPITDEWVDQQRRKFRVGEQGRGAPFSLGPTDFEDPEFDPEKYPGGNR